MYNLLTKRGQLFAFVLGFVLLAIYYGIVQSGLSDWVGAGSPKDTSIFNFGLKVAIALVAIAAILALIFGVINLAKTPKGGLKGLMLAGGLALVLLLSYMLASPEATGTLAEKVEKFNLSSGILKFITAGLTATGVLGALAIALVVFSEIRNVFK